MFGKVKEIISLDDELPDLQDGKAHLLFVDDEASNRASFKVRAISGLRNIADRIEVTIFENSEDLRDFLLRQPDLSNVVVATDNDMPAAISGTKLAIAVREQFPSLPIAIWTGHPQNVEEDPTLPVGIPVFDKVRLADVFDQFVKPSLTKILDRPKQPATSLERGVDVPAVIPNP